MVDAGCGYVVVVKSMSVSKKRACPGMFSAAIGALASSSWRERGGELSFPSSSAIGNEVTPGSLPRSKWRLTSAATACISSGGVSSRSPQNQLDPSSSRSSRLLRARGAGILASGVPASA